MTDTREILQLAAKAAGIEGLEWNKRLNCLSSPSTEGLRFDPLDDDGDALRLAVKLDMEIKVNRVDAFTEVIFGYSVGMVSKEFYGTDLTQPPA